MSQTAALHPESPSSFAAGAGQVLMSVAKNVPGRGVLWAVIAFMLGALAVGLSFVIGMFALDRGATLLTYLLVIPAAIPFAGGALFFVHGLHRGAARAALELEQKFGLVRHVVVRVVGLLDARVGDRLRDLPLAELQRHLEGAVDQYLGSDDLADGATGIAAWVVRRAKRAIARRIELVLLAAFRAEEQADGSGGGVSLAKVGDRVAAELSARLGKMVMSPLNKQLVIFMAIYLVVAAGWWFWLFALLRLFGVAAGR